MNLDSKFSMQEKIFMSCMYAVCALKNCSSYFFYSLIIYITDCRAKECFKIIET